MGCRAMAPVVHGLEKKYSDRADFLYLDIRNKRNRDAQQHLGFQGTPHFFFLRADGTIAEQMQGVVPADSLEAGLRRVTAQRTR